MIFIFAFFDQLFINFFLLKRLNFRFDVQFSFQLAERIRIAQVIRLRFFWWTGRWEQFGARTYYVFILVSSSVSLSSFLSLLIRSILQYWVSVCFLCSKQVQRKRVFLTLDCKIRAQIEQFNESRNETNLDAVSRFFLTSSPSPSLNTYLYPLSMYICVHLFHFSSTFVSSSVSLKKCSCLYHITFIISSCFIFHLLLFTST